jgi:hypothetical protein
MRPDHDPEGATGPADPAGSEHAASAEVPTLLGVLHVLDRLRYEIALSLKDPDHDEAALERVVCEVVRGARDAGVPADGVVALLRAEAERSRPHPVAAGGSDYDTLLERVATWCLAEYHRAD